MSGLNGTGVLRLGDRTPETKPVEIIRDDKPVWLRGYVQGRRCLMSVASQVAAVTDAYRDALRLVDADGNPLLDPEGNEQERADPGNALWLTRIRETIKAVIPELTPDEADVLTNSYDDAMAVLIELGWFGPRPQEPSADPEAPGEAAPATPPIPTGEPSSVATPSTTTTTPEA